MTAAKPDAPPPTDTWNVRHCRPLHAMPSTVLDPAGVQYTATTHQQLSQARSPHAQRKTTVSGTNRRQGPDAATRQPRYGSGPMGLAGR